MNGYADDLETLLEDLESDEYEERTRRRGRLKPGVRTPSRQSSFMPRPTPSVASQGQVQAATRNLDAKIETLSNAVKALETRTNGIAAEQDRTTAMLRKEVTDRKKSTDATRAELQQTKLLGVLLPLITQETVTVEVNEQRVDVLAPSSNQLAQLLPILFLLPGSYGGDGAKGPLGDTTTTLLLVLALSGSLGRR